MKRRCGARRLSGAILLDVLIGSALALGCMSAAVRLYERIHRHTWQQLATARMHGEAIGALTMLRFYTQQAGFGLPRDLGNGVAPAGNPWDFGSLSGPAPAACNGVPLCPQPRGDGISLAYRADAIGSWKSRRGVPLDCQGREVERHALARTEARFRVVADGDGSRKLVCANSRRPNGETVQRHVREVGTRIWLDGQDRPGVASAFAPGDGSRLRGVDLCVVIHSPLAVGARGSGAGHDFCDADDPPSNGGRDATALRATVAVRNAGPDVVYSPGYEGKGQAE